MVVCVQIIQKTGTRPAIEWNEINLGFPERVLSTFLYGGLSQQFISAPQILSSVQFSFIILNSSTYKFKK